MSMIITNAGRNAVAAALANNVPITVAEIAFGTENRYPTGGETALTAEVIRKPVMNYGTTEDGKTFFDARLEADDGPFVLYEIGLFDGDGTLLFVGRIEGFNKLVMADQPVTLDMRVYVLTSQFQNVVVQIDTSFAFVSAERKISAGNGLSGGGDLSQDRELALDFSGLGALAAAAIHLTDDTLVVWDASAAQFKSLNMDAVTEKVLGTTRFASALVSGGRWLLKAAAYTAKSGERIAADVSVGAWQLDLPAAPVAGDVVTVAVIDGDVTADNLTINGNGNNVQGDAALVVDVALATVPLVFSGTEWRIA
ncbi:phage tail protein [Leisingera sp. HS039]|uniref:phage tail-collar fiber domain-containing protein n=1 Tax=Leisingera sp. HS039 TaxID=2818496 RepID=UPI001B39E657|nr:phage tail protein [Leisingera sp. HS039]MBQ4826553.1 phage tail protein [Leisingera sp. HS039]